MDHGSFLIRPVTLNDLDWFYEISRIVGTGFTSLPNNKEYLQRRLDIVTKSFNETIPIEERVYLFVRENLPSHELVGVCGIDVAVGYRESFYNYQISTISQSCKELDVFLEHPVLHLVNDFQEASELISFWLHPQYRGHALSKSLSLSRFLFMAQFPQWFGKEVIAEVRGVCDAEGNSPFWGAVGRHFFAMDFKQADHLTSAGKQFIADLVSREPIYVELLPEAAQKVIGVENPSSQPARHLLESEGFKFSKHIDIFDAGPLLSVDRENIKTIKNSKVATISKVSSKLENSIQVMIYNNLLNARITVDRIQENNANQIIISENIANILQVAAGDSVRYCAI